MLIDYPKVAVVRQKKFCFPHKKHYLCASINPKKAKYYDKLSAEHTEF